MRKRPEVLCDLCEQPLDTSEPYTKIEYPLTLEQRDRLVQSMPPPPKLHGQFLGLMDPRALMPSVLVLEVHRECVEGLTPIVPQAVARTCQHIVAESLKKKREREAVREFEG